MLNIKNFINILKSKIYQILHFKKFTILFSKRKDFPKLVQIQTVNRCNTSCEMCPYESTTATEKFNLMHDNLFKKIIDEITKNKETSLIVLSLQNEPLADKNIIKRAKYIKSRSSKIKIELVSNGYLLTPSISDEIYKIFDIVTLSIHATTPSTYKKVMGGLDFNKTFSNLMYIKNSREKRAKTVLRFVKQKSNFHEYKEFKRFWNRHGISVFGFDLNSRLKMIKNYDDMKHRTSKFQKIKLKLLEKISPYIFASCPIPKMSMYIRSNGDVIHCFNDWNNENIAGNLKTKTVKEVYNSKEMLSFSDRVKNNTCHKNDICTNCELYNKGIYLTF